MENPKDPQIIAVETDSDHIAAAIARYRQNHPDPDPDLDDLVTALIGTPKFTVLLQGLNTSLDISERALRAAEDLEREAKRLRSDLAMLAEKHATTEESLRQLQATVTTLRGKDASAQELLTLYAQRKKGNPSLTLRRFLDQIGASRRYRALISERTRLRRKQEDSAQPDTENERESEKGKQ